MRSERRVYSELAGALSGVGCFVADVDSPGLCIRSEPDVSVVILVRASLSWRKKLFVLVHEASHAYKLESGVLVRNDTDDEEEADRRAIVLLRFYEFDADDEEDYWEFCNEARRVRRRRPWFKV